ncbi:MAG: PAS domain S-box protein [Leptolinea sp.]|jgi:PAS domain S-box-containing protein|nr:PAS domain S-box protein [Leptolinea sp.]
MKFPDFLRSFQFEPELPDSVFTREKWIIEILHLMLIITLVPAVILLILMLTGHLTIVDTYQIYIFLLLLIIGWQGAKRGGWRWAGYIPSLLIFFLGGFNLNQSGMNHTPLLFLATSIVLSGMLQGERASFIFTLLSVITFTVVLYPTAGSNTLRFHVSILVVSFGLFGIWLLQKYLFSQLKSNIEKRLSVSRELEEETRLRQNVEATRLVQESQLKRLTDNMTDLIAEIDLNGQFLYSSPSYLPVLGYDADTIQKVNAFDLIHPDDLPMVKDTIQESLISRLPKTIQHRTRHADGHYLWFESSGKIVERESGRLTVVHSSHDITAQRFAEDETAASEMKFRSVIEGAPLGIHMFSLEEDGRLLFTGYNPYAEKMVPIDHRSMLGKTIEEVIPDLATNGLADKFREVARTGIPFHLDRNPVSNDLVQATYEVHAFQTSPGKMAVFFLDISEREKAVKAMRISEEKFSKVFTTSPETISINRFRDGLFVDVNPSFTRQLGYEPEDVIGKTSLELGIWNNPEDRTQLLSKISPDHPTSQVETFFHAKDGHLVVGLLSASLITIDNEQYLLIIMRDMTERIKAEQQLVSAHRELEKAYEATLEGWARALDLREHETADHSRRVVEYTVQMARALGIQENELIHVQRGALMHDIGKVAVPDNILLKPGPLTSDEWVIMRQHPVNAYNLLKNIEYLKPALDIPYCHHEHWDGSGYPRGLKGEEIPLMARIFTIVDVWDALLSDRPYRPAWDKPAVINYLLEQNGKLFDPKIVKLFLELCAGG